MPKPSSYLIEWKKKILGPIDIGDGSSCYADRSHVIFRFIPVPSEEDIVRILSSLIVHFVIQA